MTAVREHHVRIQFAWQRGRQPNGGGLADAGSEAFPEGHAPGDATSGTWVPVAEWLSGPNWGSHFLPRIGSEVLVEFLHGDLDQPRITGQLYNGDVAPPFALVDASNHPGTLSGLHSQSHDGGGSDFSCEADRYFFTRFSHLGLSRNLCFCPSPSVSALPIRSQR